MEPEFDPLTDSILVSDGWGTAYSAMRLRRLSLATGEETATARLGDGARCLMFSEDDALILVATDKRLVALNRTTFTRANEWRTRVPVYSNDGVWIGDKVLLTNMLKPMLGRYDLATSLCKKKNLGNCLALFVRRGQAVACLGNKGQLLTIDPATLIVREVMRTRAFRRVRYCDSCDLVGMSLGEPFRWRDDSFEQFCDSRDLRFFSFATGSLVAELRLPQPCFDFEVHDDGTQVSVSKKDRVTTYRFEPQGLLELGNTYMPDGFEVSRILPARNLIVARQTVDEHSVLAAFALQ